MKRTPVRSSRISSVGWENNTLEVQFKNGSIYQYFGVTESEYRMFINSPSLGKAITIIQNTHTYIPVF